MIVTTVNEKTKNMQMNGRRSKFNKKEAMVMSGQQEETFKNSGKASKIWSPKVH